MRSLGLFGLWRASAVRMFAANELGAAGATALALVLGSMSQLTYLDLGGDLAHVAERMIWELHLRGGRSFVPSRALRADNSHGAAGATALAPAQPLMSVASLDLSSECASVPTTIGRLFRMGQLGKALDGATGWLAESTACGSSQEIGLALPGRPSWSRHFRNT